MVLLKFSIHQVNNYLHENVHNYIFIDINNNKTINSGYQSSINQNQFAETIVDLLLNLLEKANLTRTRSIIRNTTELTTY